MRKLVTAVFVVIQSATLCLSQQPLPSPPAPPQRSKPDDQKPATQQPAERDDLDVVQQPQLKISHSSGVKIGVRNFAKLCPQ